MFLLDTNVVSELRKIRAGKADRNVARWADEVDAASLFLSAITVMELEIGILQLGRKDPAQAEVLRAWFEGLVLPEFSGRVLPIDVDVARRCARLHVPQTLSERDALIAATALTHGFTVITRNVADFKPSGVPIDNPWEPKP